MWVRFTDRGPAPAGGRAAALAGRRAELGARALERRRRLGAGVSEDDLPLSGTHLARVAACGVELRAKSRWLNAVSVRGDDAAIARVARLPFVREIRAVARGMREPRDPVVSPDTLESRGSGPGGDPGAIGPRRDAAPRVAPSGALPDYGPSRAALDLAEVPALHALGLSGEGVRIAVLDSGFDLSHPAFDSLRVVAAHDFIHADSVVADEPGEDGAGQSFHGTLVLSVLAGWAPGELIGVAWGAEYLLAKTEEISFERPAEEDWWIEALEWAEAEGADIVSSSLGYVRWDDGSGYAYPELDGDTALITIAADHAASLGVLVVNAVGNGGTGEYVHPVAPADGDSVCAVGAVDLAGERAAFSSVGPPAGLPRRTKPDVMAAGVGVRGAMGSGDDPAYTSGVPGTSMATPIVSGVAALLMEARPAWRGDGPALLAALRAGASQADAPDSLMGHGMVRGWATLAASFDPSGAPPGTIVLEARPNPCGESGTEIRYDAPAEPSGPPALAARLYDLRGRAVRALEAIPDAGRSGGVIRWDGRDDRGRKLPSGAYLLRVSGRNLEGAARVLLVR